MTQHPYKDADEDPLRYVKPSSSLLYVLTLLPKRRALCHALNVAETAPSRARHLTNTHELAVLNRASPVLPTHVLAVHDAPPTDPNVPVMLIPIDIDAFSRKLRVDIAGARQHPHPPTRILPAVPPAVALSAAVAGALLPPTVTVPVVPLQVPHAPSIALLLVYALGVHANPSALAAALLPLSAAEEFPSSAAMAQAMAALCERDNTSDALTNGSGVGGAGGWQLLDRYTVYNHGMWKNVLKLGLQDSRVMSVVQTVWNVTAESRKILARQRERDGPRA
jgi:hypothetical protein